MVTCMEQLKVFDTNVREGIEELMEIAKAFELVGNKELSYRLYNIARLLSGNISDARELIAKEIKEEQSGLRVLHLKQALDNFAEDLRNNPISTPGRKH